MRATSSSISRFDLPAASANTSSWFSLVRWGASARSPARCTCPERTTSRIAACRPGDVDTIAGGDLREAELADAEGEHRGERPIEVELALVDLAEMDEKL